MVSHALQLANFVCEASYEAISVEARTQMKLRILDSLGCALGALGAQPIRMVHKYIDEVGGRPTVSAIGGFKTSPTLAAFYNSALIRYLDYNDSYLAPGETCHPSDNLGAVLVACEYSQGTGQQLMTALALAYQIQCRLSDLAPVRERGFDHTTQGAYAAAAGVCKALGLDALKTANAICIAGAANNALRVTRTGALSHWKGLAYPNTAFNAVHAALLARQGITGPPEVFEGHKGFMQVICGPFVIDWPRESLEAVRRTSIKKYNAEIHAQSSIAAVLDIRQRNKFSVDDICEIVVETFDVAYHIIGGGMEGDKMKAAEKEQADHSLPYMLAAAIIDGELGPAQYAPDRLKDPRIRSLMKKVKIQLNESYSRKFPNELPTRVTIKLKNDSAFTEERNSYQGFFTCPMDWMQVEDKFLQLAKDRTSKSLSKDIIAAVKDLDSIQVSDLIAVLSKIKDNNIKRKAA